MTAATTVQRIRNWGFEEVTLLEDSFTHLATQYDYMELTRRIAALASDLTFQQLYIHDELIRARYLNIASSLPEISKAQGFETHYERFARICRKT